MTSIFGRAFGFAAVLAFVGLLASPAFADDGRPRVTTHAPEIDATMLGSAAALLAGGGLLLKSRRDARKRN
jgi:hypothetical protein